MKPFKPNTRGNNLGPESKIQRGVINMLERRGYFVKVTHGSAFQSGFPDLRVTHLVNGPRWVEIKNPYAWVLTNAQLHDFPLMIANGDPIWVMTAATQFEYEKLFLPHNYHEFHDAGIRGYSNIYTYRDDLIAGILRPVEIDEAKLRNLQQEEYEDD